MRVVRGKLVLDGWRGEPGPATVYARLLDTSWMDAPARTIDQVVLTDVWLDQVQAEGLTFSLSAQEVDPLARYEVSVLVDLDGDGETSVGDYRSTSSHPVLTRGFPDQVEVHAQRIG
ncbi:MAG: hypothetical protein JXA09_09030 [Anaerolineae bacterium]|nr:hypothetical protein [Anaerolineae bacterium]